jgi:CDP-glycerol glycerophosphotransferase (TagB/SpsB family)
MIRERLVVPRGCSISGSVKVSTVLTHPQMGARRRLFANDRPVVLYNPHFDPSLSSWETFGPSLAAAFRDQDQYNLVIAPHVRLARGWTPAQRAAFEALAVEDRILVDAGSTRSHDMTYTLAADIYVGDVSSQVYEFLARPRPCVFLDKGLSPAPHDSSFAFWSLGERIEDPAAVLAAVARAEAAHGAYRERQRLAAVAALGPLDGAAQAAAQVLLRIARAAT